MSLLWTRVRQLITAEAYCGLKALLHGQGAKRKKEDLGLHNPLQGHIPVT
jgi:hypothetical protein